MATVVLTLGWGSSALAAAAASKVFGVLRGLSIGGYGEGAYQNLFREDGGASNRWDLLRAVLYVGFNERIFFNSEIEFEHATTRSTRSSGAGSASVEFAELDFFAWD